MAIFKTHALAFSVRGEFHGPCLGTLSIRADFFYLGPEKDNFNNLPDVPIIRYPWVGEGQPA